MATRVLVAVVVLAFVALVLRHPAAFAGFRPAVRIRGDVGGCASYGRDEQDAAHFDAVHCCSVVFVGRSCVDECM